MIFTAIAVTLAGVTAASVGLAVYTLVAGGSSHLVVDNKVLATMFAGTAMLLDVFKYMAWPKARQLKATGQPVIARLMIGYSMALACFSGWAVFDLIDNRLSGKHAGAVAVAEQRIQDLHMEQDFSRSRLIALDGDEARVVGQAQDLRLRGMATPALSLEVEALGRIRADRAEERSRLDQVSKELTTLRATPRPTLPRWIAVLLAIGFAASLELVPVLIFLSGRQMEPDRPPVPTTRTVSEPLKDAGFVQETAKSEVRKLLEKPIPEPAPRQTESPEPLPEPEPTFKEVLEPTSVVSQEAPTAGTSLPLSDEDQELLRTLLESVRGFEPGTPVPIKPFARSVSIGNPRAGEIFKAAEAVGALVKTTRGYVAA